MFDDIFDMSKKYQPNIAIEKINSHGFSDGVLLLKVTGYMIYSEGRDVVLHDHELRNLTILLRGEREIFTTNKVKNFIFPLIAFYENEPSLNIKKEIIELCNKYFPEKEESEDGLKQL